ncbi:Uncharacterised protein [Stenotrophomonas maltophilia]|nr:Uncharacterised protein [Stenotrophomonas maltophilia]
MGHREMQQHQHAGHAAGVGGEAHRTDARDHLATAEQVQRVAERTAQYQQAADDDLPALALKIVAEGEQHAQIAQHQRTDLPAARALPCQQHVDQQHQGRVQVKNQPLQGHADVLQALEIEQAGQVVAGEAQPQHAGAVGPGQRLCPARSPQCHQHEQRQRHQHAQGEQRGGIDAVAQAELDDDGLAGGGDGADRGQADTPQRDARGSGGDTGSGAGHQDDGGPHRPARKRVGAPSIAWGAPGAL